MNKQLWCGSQVLRSIGYKTIQIDEEVPLDSATGTIANTAGRVVNGESTGYCHRALCLKTLNGRGQDIYPRYACGISFYVSA